jgi:hypothetical protein
VGTEGKSCQPVNGEAHGFGRCEEGTILMLRIVMLAAAILAAASV